MRRGAALVLIAFLVSAGGQARSHGGGLNAEGCHTNRATGDYHCHRAPRAAQPTSPVQQLAPAPGNKSNRSCGAKKTCGQMASCEEAMFYLTQCGLSRLDGDSDGVPCESLCG
jgi:hypothetical protein